MRAWGWVALVVVGCGNHHVRIPPPPAGLTPEQRVQAFQQYRQGGSGVEWTTRCSANGACTTTSRDVLLLRDGTEIRHADDLLPILAPGSRAASAAQEVADAHGRQRRWKRIGWTLFLGGVGLIVAGAVTDTPELTGAGLLLGISSPFVAVTGMWVAGWGIGESTKAAFAGYDQSVAERFNVCVNGLAVVPCERNTPGSPPPPVEPDPALRSLRRK